jgi:hypothetical protein
MQLLFFLAMAPLPLILRGWRLAAWAVIMASSLAGLTAHATMSDQKELLLAYAAIDCAAGLLVQIRRTWQAKALGCVYGVMILSHFALYTGYLQVGQHGNLGGYAGMALVVFLWVWGLDNGGIADLNRASRDSAGTGKSGDTR